MSVLDRDLTYHVAPERLSKLSTSMSRKAFEGVRLTMPLWFAIFIIACLFVPLIEREFAGSGWPSGAGFYVLAGIFLVGLAVIKFRGEAPVKPRADFDAEVTFRQDAGGLRIANKDIEYYLKWPGIAQILIEPDGLVVSHGHLLFLVPDTAFASVAERDALVREIFANLGQDAKDRSIAHVRPLLAAFAEGV